MKAILPACTLVILAGPAREQTLDVKPGLWEVTRTIESRGLPPVEKGRMTPERVEGTAHGKFSGGGHVMTTQGTFTGHWLAADCGRRN